MSSRAAAAPTVPAPAPAPAARSMIYLGMDVHKDSITIAVLPASAKTPTRLEKLANDLPKLKKWIERVARDGEIHACYEASGAGYVLHRALAEWGYACDVIAPSLIPKRSGVHRKHDKRDAADLARLYRAGELVAVRIPSEADERVRDVVRCRETFQREILKSRHYILKFLAKRGFVFREGTNWCTPHLKWLQHLTTDGAPRQELEDVVPRLQDLALKRLPAAHDVADPFIRLARDAHRDQLAGAMEPRQVGRVARVVFPVDPGPLRDQRGRDHVAGVSPFRERPMEHIARAARFIARVDLAVARDPGDPLLEFGEVVRQSLEPRRRLRRCREYGDRDRVLVYIHAEIDDGASRRHGRRSSR